MILESKVLDEMLGTKHFPNVYYIGPYKNCNFIVMQMLGRNLGDIRKVLPHKKMSISSSVRIGIQIVEALSLLHTKGWLHRDLKPTNCCLGQDEKRRQVYLVDFGMSRRFRNDDGSNREVRHYCGFRGTTRYCSYRMHDRREQGPVDDLWCLYYTLAELVEGYLPWRDMESVDEMAQAKKIIKHDMIFPSMPSKFSSFDRNLRRLRQHSTPDYVKFQNILASCVKYVDDNAEFEWDILGV
uniref:Protein kinase domain-containing protein n=1 Tax=Caenorhabditis japonica TaxID=281687 RepID=A0A8R1EU97_CAEJA